MPVHVGQMTSEVTMLDGEVPLTAAQVEKLVRLVLERLEQQQRDRRQANDATTIRRQAAPPARSGL